MDDHLNFPLKVDAVAGLARHLNLEVHFSACGVGASWSQLAQSLFKRALSDALTITVRDRSSVERLERFLPGLPASPRMTFDPAIWAAEVYGRCDEPAADQQLVGIGLLGLHEVNAYAPKNAAFNDESLARFWIEVMARLYQEGVAFEVFTNGTASDHLFAQQVCREAQKELAFEPRLSERPIRPRDLAQQISRYKAVLASRLHGGIVALSYGIPVAGLAWDDKVRSFFADTGRSELCVSIYDRNPDAVVKALLRSVQEGVDGSALGLWKDRARENAIVVLSKSTLGL